MTDPTPSINAPADWILRLWTLDSYEFLWSSEEIGPTLDEFLSERYGMSAEHGDWVAATIDGDAGRVWAGRARLGDDGKPELLPEYEFLTVVQIPGIRPDKLTAAKVAELIANPLIAKVTDTDD